MLTITTCQATNTFAVTQQLADYLTTQLDQSVRNVTEVDWEARYRRLDAGRIDIGWICGLPYTLRAAGAGALELLAAPVMAGRRYREEPIYFSDVVIRADSPYREFLDLRGAAWAYNEPGSQSGNNIVRFHLAQLGENGRFFRQTIPSGAHLASLQMVLDGRADAAAIDSTVLEWELAQRPALADQICIIAVLGPSPIPPLVIQKKLPPSLKKRIRALLLGLHTMENGRHLLAIGRLRRFTAVTDQDYDPIRRMARQGAAVVFNAASPTG